MGKTSARATNSDQYMDKNVRNTLIWISGFIALILGLFLYNFLAPKQLTEMQYQELGYFGFTERREIRPFQLVDQDGDSVGLSSLKGRWSLLFFGFTYCPDICPTTLGVLNQAMKKIETPPSVILVSVDPERDTPSLLKQYMVSFNPSFKGYTGEFDQIVGLATNLNVAFGKVPGPQPGTYLVDHSASIVVVSPEGKYAGFIKAPHQAEKIATIVNSLQR